MKDLKFVKLEDRIEPRTTQKESSLELDALPGTWLNTTGGIGKVIIASQNSKLRLPRLWRCLSGSARHGRDGSGAHLLQQHYFAGC